MSNPVLTIIHKTNKTSKQLNILTFPTHERYETQLAKTGHNFYAFRNNNVKNWNTKYASIPKNYHLLEPNKIPDDIEFDLILSQNKFGQFQIAQKLAYQLHLPIVSLEHTLPAPFWDEGVLQQTKKMNGVVNVFISDYSKTAWGYFNDLDNDNAIIEHSIDTSLFNPGEVAKRKNHILSVNNDFINRDYCLNFKQYQEVTSELPTNPVGDTPGFSEPAKNTEDLIDKYRESKVFLNTAHISPIPTALLEAMACGCAVVSCNTCMVPEYIEPGYNGLLARSNEEMREHLTYLLANDALAYELGQNAVKTIKEKCSEDRFIEEWNNVFERASKGCFK